MKNAPELTTTERLILANQYEILGILREDESCEKISSNLRDGHKWLYDQIFDYISPDLSDRQTKHVLDVLSMYELLKASYIESADKGEIKEDELEFPGFDGNNEAELRQFAKALLQDDRYVHVLGDSVKNSHMPTAEIYERMLSELQELKNDDLLSATEIRKILNARIHPSAR